ncbi:MAG: adenylyl cyclase, partial [Pseudomonadota bacterium]
MGAWLIVEMSSVVLPALEMPDWTLRAVIFAAAAGFPLFLILAWIFDLTPDGLVRSVDAADLPPDEDVAPTLKGGVARAVDAVIIGILLLLAMWLWQRPAISGEQPPADIPSIAVLAFDDLSEAGDSEYFADGIAEELLNALAKIDGLHVPSRTSSFAFKGSQEDIRTIGKRLDVQTVLEGSVRRVGNEVRITAQLIDSEDGYHLWSETYDRELTDIFAVQDEIAAAIVEALKQHLALDDDMMESMTVSSAEVASIEAYDLYLLGRHHWHQ